MAATEAEPGPCPVHAASPAVATCAACRRPACARCLVDEEMAICRTCLGARRLEVEGDLMAIGLLNLALAGAWLLFGTTLFGQLFGLAGQIGSVVLSGVSLLAALSVRSGHPSARFLQTFLSPVDATFVVGLFTVVDWMRLPDYRLCLWLFVAQALILLGLLLWSVYRVNAPDLQVVYTAEYRALRHLTSPVEPAPFPFYWAGSILFWLLLQMMFLVVYTRLAWRGI